MREIKRESRGKGLHHRMTHAPPCDSPGTLLCHQDMEERFISHFNEIFKERILPINNHELECLCVSLWLTFLPCQAGSAVSSVKREKQNIHGDWGCRPPRVERTCPHTQRGESRSRSPLLQTAAYSIDLYIGVARNFNWVFPYLIMEKPEWTFFFFDR